MKPDADRADELVLAYIDGRMTPTERSAFELRLGREPELARAFEAFVDTAEGVRTVLRMARAPAERPSSQRRRLWPYAAAAALVLGLLFVGARLVPHRTAVGFQVAVVPSAPSDEGFNELLGFDREWLPAGMGYRGAESSGRPTPDEYAAGVEAALTDLIERAFAAPPASTRAFVLAFRPERDCHALLFAARPAPSGAATPERLVPPASSDEPAADASFFRGGATHLLPAPPVRLPADWRATMRVEYRPGILTRGGTRVLLAVRDRPPEEPAAVFDDRAATLPDLRDQLERDGWSCSLLDVE